MGKLDSLVRHRLTRHLKITMLAGILLLVPVVITYVLLRWVFDFIDGVLQPAISGALGRSIPGLGLVALLVVVYLLGLVWANTLGRRLIETGQETLVHLPVVGTVYAPARQLIESFTGSGASGVKRVVLIEYPREGAWMVGFLTGMTTVEHEISMGIVYVPTAPTPNSGWVALVPLADIYDTDLTVQEAMKLVLSGGISAPSQIERRRLSEPLPEDSTGREIEESPGSGRTPDR